MVIKSKTYLGGVTYEYTIEEKDEMDTLHKIIVLSNPRDLCNECGNKDKEEFQFTTNKDKEGNTYVNVRCKCGARSKLGQYKTGGYFWHDFEKYVPPTKQTAKKQVEEEDINF